MDTADARGAMVDVQIAGRGIRDKRVLEAMHFVPREAFVDSGFEEFAYEDGPLPIGAGQTISQPYVVALMLEAAELAPSDRVLEVGAGSGYAAALISRIAARVYAVERQESLIAPARSRFENLGYGNIELRSGDGTRGWPEVAPFDVIIVSAHGPQVPDSLKNQLASGGRLIIPVGGWETAQELLKITRKGATEYEEESLGAVRFVPLIGEHGWAEDGRQAASNQVARAQRYAKQRPKSVENCGADIELKARSQPIGTRLDARSSGGSGLDPLLAGAGALVSRSLLSARSTTCGL
jgi:protein-L-isoaspartate(D-aspartate) O-methyltransferase